MIDETPAVNNVREEERVFGIAYDRALAIVPRLICRLTGEEPVQVAEGYFVAHTSGGSGSGNRELTVRLARHGADTRVRIRVETSAVLLGALLFVVVFFLTLGLGLIVMVPWTRADERKRRLERESLVHRTFDVIEVAVAEQGATANYRIAPGASTEEARAAAHDDAVEDPRTARERP